MLAGLGVLCSSLRVSLKDLLTFPPPAASPARSHQPSETCKVLISVVAPGSAEASPALSRGDLRAGVTVPESDLAQRSRSRSEENTMKFMGVFHFRGRASPGPLGFLVIVPALLLVKDHEE